MAKKSAKIRSESELRKLALDIRNGLVFTSWMCRPEEITSVFMLALFMDKKTIRKLKADKVVHFFEYTSQAAPRSVNGLPCFFSCQTLKQPEMDLLVPMMKELEESDKQFLGATK